MWLRGAEQSLDKCCRMCRLDVVLRDGDFALFVDDECRADDTLNGLAVHLLLAVGAPGRQHFAVGIGQQRERQLLGVAELRQLLRLVGGDADDVEAGVVEVVQVVPEIAGLLRAAGSRRRRVEVNDDAPAFVIGQRYLLPLGVQVARTRARFVARREAMRCRSRRCLSSFTGRLGLGLPADLG